MSINFAAANMAGYNNPNIEVFSAIAGENNTLSGAPSKSALLDCINRGSVPFIVLVLSGNQSCILPLNGIYSDGEIYSFSFCGCIFAVTQPVVVSVAYPLTNDTPVYEMKPLPTA